MRFFTVLLATAVSLAAWGQALGSDRTGPTVVSGSDEAHAAVTWATERFERAGLQAPTVAITFHTDRSACDGHPGLFWDGPAPRIDMCPRLVSDTAGRKLLLHELSHAWAYESLSEVQMERFVALRGLEVWHDPRVSWELEGNEHAAEILSWALFDRELDLVTIAPADPAAIEAAYRALTGSPLPDR